MEVFLDADDKEKPHDAQRKGEDEEYHDSFQSLLARGTPSQTEGFHREKEHED